MRVLSGSVGTTTLLSQSDLSSLIEKVSNLSGGMKITPIQIQHDNSQPIFLKNCAIAYGLCDSVKSCLDRMVESGIIKKVTSAKWAPPIVTPMKMNGQPRVCGDFIITVNSILNQCALITLEPEYLFIKLNDYSCFSKIDLKNVFFASTT